MGQNSKIEWTTHTLNPWRGCTKISEGCTRCYADTMSKRNPATLGVWGPNGTRVVASEAMWKEPLKWNRDAQAAYDDWHTHEMDMGPPPERPRVFCASLADVFENWQGPMSDSEGNTWTTHWHLPLGWGSLEPLTMDHVRDRLFRLIDATPNLDWLLLTKRPENIAKMMPTRQSVPVTDDAEDAPDGALVDGAVRCGNSWEREFRPNVWLGVSVENQEQADKRIPLLLQTPAAVRFLSCEPLLGPIDYLASWLVGCSDVHLRPRLEQDRLAQRDRHLRSIDWVIIGGESGPGARPCNIEWIRDIVRQCKAAGTSCFVKQLGSRPLNDQTIPRELQGVIEAGGPGYFLPLKDKKGGNMEEWPTDLRVREFPQATTEAV